MCKQRTSKFALGDKVNVGDIKGIVQTISFHRDMCKPLYKVEWWHEGGVHCSIFNENDLERDSTTEMEAQCAVQEVPDGLEVNKRFKIGDNVYRAHGYKRPGVVVASFTTLAGANRIVVECTIPEMQGALHIYSNSQVKIVD